MKLNSISNLNFNKIYRKVHTRDPILIQEKLHPASINDTYTFSLFSKNNSEINEPSVLSDTQKTLYSIEFDRLLNKQEIARSRCGNIYTRLRQMHRCGYLDLRYDISRDTLYALLNLKYETISALNDSQLYRICKFNNGNRDVKDGLVELEKEFSLEELQRISERESSTIINTWISKMVPNDDSFVELTKYIHKLARK